MTKLLSNAAASKPTAGLGLSHGYCFEGDIAHLNAELVAHNPELAGTQEWALQLWAGKVNDSFNPANCTKVAEVALGSPFGTSQNLALVQGESAALPPAGSEPYAIFLALATGTQGLFDTIHDFADYPQSEIFVQPRLCGAISHKLSDNTLELKIDGIENQRAADNLSGTLALELWSLSTPYQGTQWTGSPVASLIVGTLSGQCRWSDLDYATNAALPEQPGYLTLMLREWTPAGYVTRDFRTLAEPKQIAQTAPKSETKPVAKAAPKAGKQTAPAKEAPAASTQPSKTAPAAKAAEASSSTGTSINKATEAELIAVKGLGATVARAIIAGRPYAALEELCRVKGMGAKLLAKIKSQLKL